MQILSVEILEFQLETGDLDQWTYLSMLATFRSLYSELRVTLKGRELSGTEATALFELQRRLFEAGSRNISQGGQC